jgi:protein Tex
MQDKNFLPFTQSISTELALPISSVQAVLQLFAAGNTIPFIARYRKEATGNLDEVQIKNIQDRYTYLLELEERRQTILSSIESQGKLTDDLREQILSCQIKTTLEDLYLPYKPKRRTRAMIAKEKGLEPLADLILQQPLTPTPESAAHAFINSEKGVEDGTAALAGARDIVAERVAENAAVRAAVRETFASEGIVISKVREEKASESSKFEQYYDFKESVRTIPSHRYLAIRRGEREGILDFSIKIEADPILRQIQQILQVNSISPFCEQLKLAIEDGFNRLLCPSVETDVRLDLKWASDRSAVAIFADNLRHLLLASPLGGRPVLGIDPGLRTGCKCAVIDSTGKYLESATLYLSQGENAQKQAKDSLKVLLKAHQPYAIAIGNGTAGRETETFIRRFLKEISWTTSLVVLVNEAGASVYSASEVAREEFPELDLTIRGAISIARRLQDPLAELVKIDPKSIGVGQYQHDVHQPLLQDELQHVVESCVNRVGVDLNTASASLLSYVSGIGPTLARKIVKHRETCGAFRNRKNLRDVAGFGSKTFEQAAGFLRICNGDNPLDASAVHPERYEFVQQMAGDLKVTLAELICNPTLANKIDPKQYIHIVGELTLADIIQELKKPGRDPRASFEPPSFRDDILSIQDLKPGLRLEGIVTNVTAFGAFVDVGVHQDGLIHLSELSDQYIKHPSDVVKTGDKIKVEVLQVDIARRRISLTARLGQNRQGNQPSNFLKQEGSKTKPKQSQHNFNSNPFASL